MTTLKRGRDFGSAAQVLISTQLPALTALVGAGVETSHWFGARLTALQ